MKSVFWRLMASLDIILPVYHPSPGWEDVVIRRFQSLVKALPELNLGLFVVNDGSSPVEIDRAFDHIRQAIPAAALVTYETNMGKGFALRKGVEASGADYLLYTDIDWPYDETSVMGIIHLLTNGADVAIGVRHENYYTQLPEARRRISSRLRTLNTRLLKLKVDDTQAGLKGFHSGIKPIFLSTTINRYLFDLEFVYLLSKNSLISIQTYPVQLRPGVTFRQMKRGILFQEGLNFLKIWLGKK